MKKISRRSFLLAAGSAAALAALTACGSSSSSTAASSTAASSAAASESAAPAAAESGEILLGIWPEDTMLDEIKMHEGFVASFNELHPGVTVVPDYYKYSPDTYIPMAAAGNAPTIFETWYTEPQKLIRNEIVKDITGVLEQYGWADSINPSVKSLMTDENGHIYGVPRDAYALGLMLNVNLFEQAGLVDANGVPQYPKTWEELAETGKILKEKTGKAALCLLAKDNAGGWHWSNIAWAFGAELCIENSDGTFTSNLNTPEAVQAMEYVKSLKWDYDILTSDPMQEDWGTGFTQLGTGAAAMYIAANDAVMQPTYSNGLAVDKLALVPMPAGPKGQYSLMGGTPYMFSPDATDEEVGWCLDYLNVMGKGPEVTDLARDGWIADAEYRRSNGIPVIPNFPAYVGEVVTEQNKIVEEYSNVDMALYQDYFDFNSTEGALHPEEGGDTQKMYEILTGVMQAVLTDKNADVQALMDKANSDYQAHLDNM